jgi:hypothetical protein
MKRYIVAVNECDPATGPEAFRRYVWALCQASYSNKEGRRWFVDSPGEAFVFTTLAAAEMAAVWVGGTVEVHSGSSGLRTRELVLAAESTKKKAATKR